MSGANSAVMRIVVEHASQVKLRPFSNSSVSSVIGPLQLGHGMDWRGIGGPLSLYRSVNRAALREEREAVMDNCDTARI